MSPIKLSLSLAFITCHILFCGQAWSEQASLTLKAGDALISQWNNTDWSLDKHVSSVADDTNGAKVVTWDITATRGATSDNQLTVEGFISIQNTGGAPASIGNIVINLQRTRLIDKKNGSKWVSASIDAADATNADAATLANIVASGSQETPAWNALYNAPTTYVVTGSKGILKENAASGALSFIDKDANDVWSLSPKKTIPVGGTVNLLYTAAFDNSVLNIPQGETVRAEIIVSFGNAGARGGSGATALNIDVNGSNTIEIDEANVRSVPVRVTRSVPALDTGNNTVALLDLGMITSGSVVFGSADYQGYDNDEDITQTTAFSAFASGVGGGDSGGTICNEATLTGDSDFDSVIIGYLSVVNPDNSITQQPIYYNFPRVTGVDLSASDCAQIDPEVVVNQGFEDGNYCTYSQGGYGGKGAPYSAVLAPHFAAAFPSGIEVGIPGASGYSMTFATSAKVQGYLPAGGTPNKLTSDLINPTSTSAGAFGGQVLALHINVGFSDSGATPNTTGAFGNLYYCNASNPSDSLSGLNVKTILAKMETALGGGALPSGYNYGSLNSLADNLNTQAFHECSVGPFASSLSRSPCQ